MAAVKGKGNRLTMVRDFQTDFTRLYILFDQAQLRRNYLTPSMVPGLHSPVQAAKVSSKLPYPAIDVRRSLVSRRRSHSSSNQETIAMREESVMKTKVWTRPEVKENSPRMRDQQLRPRGNLAVRKSAVT